MAEILNYFILYKDESTTPWDRIRICPKAKVFLPKRCRFKENFCQEVLKCEIDTPCPGLFHFEDVDFKLPYLPLINEKRIG